MKFDCLFEPTSSDMGARRSSNLASNPTWLPIGCRFKNIANHKAFLEATRFSNATRGGSTIYRGKGLWKKPEKPRI